MANMIARLGVLLGLDSSEFVSGIEKADKKLLEFAAKSKVYAAAGAAAMSALITKSMDYADQISDVAKANDVAIDSVLKLSNALANSGGKADDAGKLLSGFTKFMDEAAQGSLKAQQSLQKTGVSLKDLGSMATQDLFQKTLEGIAKIEDPLTRNAKAMEIFGKAAKGVDFPGLVADMNRMKDITDKQADGIQQMGDSFDALAESSRKFQTQLAAELGPSMKQFIDYITAAKGESSGLATVIKFLFDVVVGIGANAIYIFKELSLEISTFFKQMSALGKLDMKKFFSLDEESRKKSREYFEEILEFNKKLMGAEPIAPFRPSQNYGPGMGPQIKRKVTEALDEDDKVRQKTFLKGQLEMARQRQENAKLIADEILKEYKLVDAVSERQELNKRQLDVQKELIDLEARSRQFLPEELAFRKELVQIEFQRAEAVKAIQAMQIPQEEKNKLIEKENELSFKALDIARQRLAVEKARRQGGFMEGVQQGFTDWVQKLPTELERGQQAFSSVMDSMNAALERFVRTGKLSFRDLIRDMIQNLLLLQMKAQMNSIFSSFLGKLFGTGNIYGAGEFNQGMPGFGGAYADGGSPPVDRASIVGERGPELFVPRTAGTIIPNSAMGMMGNTTNVTNNYINAIDTKSFEDRILGSSSAIWAANAYAQKSLAVGRGRA